MARIHVDIDDARQATASKRMGGAVSAPLRTVTLDTNEWTEVIDAIQEKVFRFVEVGLRERAERMAIIDALLREQVDQCVTLRLCIDWASAAPAPAAAPLVSSPHPPPATPRSRAR